MILHGDALDKLREIESESIDMICTDPPYGIAFMGKQWDKALPDPEIWRECLRVLKPGAFAFVMCTPRQDSLSRMITALEEAGFVVGFTSIYWVYGSGFPKAMNIGKAVDKRGGVNLSWFGGWLKEWRQANKISQKEIAILFPSKTGGLTGCVANWEFGFNIPTTKQFNKICEHFRLPYKNIKEIEREVVGESNNKIHLENLGQAGYKETWDITTPATPQAQALDGSYGGFQPKPALEPVLVVMKPLSESTFVAQALKSGKGISWLDDGRIPYQGEGDFEHADRYTGKGSPLFDTQNLGGGELKPQGRFPANVICSDNALDTGAVHPTGDIDKSRNNSCSEFNPGGYMKLHQGDSGSFSRFFDLDAWFDHRFGERKKELPKAVQRTFPFMVCPKPSSQEKDRGLENKEPQKWRGNYQDASQMGILDLGNSPKKKAKNHHPTCKSIKLMSWLITIGSRPGDIVLDPFCGSGTTLCAARMLDRQWIGIEKELEYIEIAEKRVEAWGSEAPLFVAGEGQ